MTELHVAQLNVARARGPMTGPVMAGFVALLEEINALAERGPTVHAFTLKARFDGPARDPLAAVPE